MLHKIDDEDEDDDDDDDDEDEDEDEDDDNIEKNKNKQNLDEDNEITYDNDENEIEVKNEEADKRDSGLESPNEDNDNNNNKISYKRIYNSNDSYKVKCQKYNKFIKKVRKTIYIKPETMGKNVQKVVKSVILQFQIAAFRCFVTKSTLEQWISFILNPVAIAKYERGKFEFDIKHFEHEKGYTKTAYDKWKNEDDWKQHCDVSIKIEDAEEAIINRIKSLKKITKKWTEVKNIDWSNKYLWEEWQIPPEERYLYDKEDIFDEKNEADTNLGEQGIFIYCIQILH